MINMLKGFVLGLLVGIGGLLVLGYTHHVVRHPEGLKLVPKTEWSFRDIYVDVREWGAFDYMRDKELSRDMVKHGIKGIQQEAESAYQEGVKKLESGIEEFKREIGKLGSNRNQP